MAAKKGNSYWRNRLIHGRPLEFKTPQELWDKCVDYFEWVEKTPLKETKPFAFRGRVTKAQLPLRRIMTLAGLRIHIGIAEPTWADYRAREDFSGVCALVEEIIRNQKLEGAAAGQFNAMIIARDLGLRDNVGHSGPDGGPIEVKGINVTFI
jgi:hypothetical protein